MYLRIAFAKIIIQTKDGGYSIIKNDIMLSAAKKQDKERK